MAEPGVELDFLVAADVSSPVEYTSAGTMGVCGFDYGKEFTCQAHVSVFPVGFRPAAAHHDELHALILQFSRNVNGDVPSGRRADDQQVLGARTGAQERINLQDYLVGIHRIINAFFSDLTDNMKPTLAQ